eukprot:TRINITY_DN2249_c0_g2_i1.p1 TRINITY_DN2249_c0_g2~~TRINITY_DN2249_c0_g2_i1.p1  ORF type:complete len:481 (+),score=96.56 TRINITY_DN2249_c0_g2_i1:189-1631(+)
MQENCLENSINMRFGDVETPQQRGSSVIVDGTLLVKKSLSRSFDEAYNEGWTLVKRLVREKRPLFRLTRATSSPDVDFPRRRRGMSYSRKEKSLGELSKKFLFMFGRIDECFISLDAITSELGVERRRIYDIINILESLGVVARKGKNNYAWKGLASIFEHLRQVGAISGGHASPGRRRLKKEKSLGILSSGFIKLFLEWKDVLSLEQAARRLSAGGDAEEKKLKTKVRRLYDIANVFSALGLIRKTNGDAGKPAFCWVGAPGLEAFIARVKTCKTENELFPPKSGRRSGVKDLEGRAETSGRATAPSEKIGSTIRSDNSAFRVSDGPRDLPPAYQESFQKFMSFMFSQFCQQVLSKPPQSDAQVTPTHMREDDLFMRTLNRAMEAVPFPYEFKTPDLKKTISAPSKETEVLVYNKTPEAPDAGPSLQALGDRTNLVKRRRHTPIKLVDKYKRTDLKRHCGNSAEDAPAEDISEKSHKSI